MGRDSSVGIVTGYGLDGLGIESWTTLIQSMHPILFREDLPEYYPPIYA